MSSAILTEQRDPGPGEPGPIGPTWLTGLWRRQLPHYPDTGPRTLYLSIVVLATIILYYELYIQGAVATQILAEYGMSLRYFIVVSVIGNAIGAFASLAAGLADRWGRANLVAYGLAVTGVLIAFALPNASNKEMYVVLFALVSLVEGVILVATPALIRDFSPQLGRAQAMGFWTLGPVLGSLVVTSVSSSTLESHPRWQFQFQLCGAIGLVVFVIALFGLRELSPRLRDQLMVSARDRALIEAKAAGIDPETATNGAWRQMFKLDVLGSAFAISVFLLFYYIAVGFFVIYFALNFGYTPARANGLANWYWIANAIALVVTGVLSDRLGVRKPFMVIGGFISLVGVGLFAALATHPDTGYYTFAWVLALTAAGGGMAYCAWMASFTETVERHNPAATAIGLAVWGWTIRMVITFSLIGFMFVVSAASVLVDKGTEVQTLATKYASQLATVAKVDPGVLATLSATPTDPTAGATAVAQIAGIPVGDVVRTATLAAGNLATLAPADQAFLATTGPKVQAATADLQAVAAVPPEDFAYLQANGAAVTKAAEDSPGQWQTWWWVCFAGQLLFFPFIFVLTGRWSPKKAKQDAAEHQQAVQREMASLGVS